MNDVDDACLIRKAREGNTAAVRELYLRYRPAAHRYAYRIADDRHVEDLVSEAFTRVFQGLMRGNGPDEAFRPYLMATVKNLHIDHLRRSKREVLMSEVSDVESPTLVVHDSADRSLEASLIGRALKALPPRWRTVLWYTEVMGEPLEKVAQRIGSNANAVAGLAFRAREGFRQAYLAAHVNAGSSGKACVDTLALLPRYVRGALPARKGADVASHLRSCERCRDALDGLREVNTNLPVLLLPVVAAAGSFGVVPPPSGTQISTLLRKVTLGAVAKVSAAAAIVLGLTACSSAAPVTAQQGHQRAHSFPGSLDDCGAFVVSAA
jgi:RNA polymerase sigma factor (sigma-70 family)